MLLMAAEIKLWYTKLEIEITIHCRGRLKNDLDECPKRRLRGSVRVSIERN